MFKGQKLQKQVSQTYSSCVLQIYHGDIHLLKVSRKYLDQFLSNRVDRNILQKSLFSKFKGP